MADASNLAKQNSANLRRALTKLGKIYGLNDFINYAFSALNLDWEKYVVSNKSLKRPSEIKQGFGSPKKANSKLNWQAKTLMPEIAAKMAQHEFEIFKDLKDLKN